MIWLVHIVDKITPNVSVIKQVATTINKYLDLHVNSFIKVISKLNGQVLPHFWAYLSLPW